MPLLEVMADKMKLNFERKIVVTFAKTSNLHPKTCELQFVSFTKLIITSSTITAIQNKFRVVRSKKV